MEKPIKFVCFSLQAFTDRLKMSNIDIIEEDEAITTSVCEISDDPNRVSADFSRTSDDTNRMSEDTTNMGMTHVADNLAKNAWNSEDHMLPKHPESKFCGIVLIMRNLSFVF